MQKQICHLSSVCATERLKILGPAVLIVCSVTALVHCINVVAGGGGCH